MRVFRDETTLATSPELWQSIESALMHSERDKWGFKRLLPIRMGNT